MFMGTSVGMVRATIFPPAAAAADRGGQLVLNAIGGTGVDGQHVPVERPLGGHAHGGHQVDLLGGEGVQASVRDVLERRALVGGHLLAEGEHLPAVGVAGADGTSVAVGVGAGLRRREPQPSGRQGLGQQGAHGGNLVVGRHLFAAVGAHDLAPQGAVPHQEPGVDAEPAVQDVEVLTEGRPVPRHAVLQGGEGHSLDLGHHLTDVVRILRVDGGERKATVAPDDGGHAVHVGGGGQRIPEQLRVVVRVRVDHAGHDRQPPASNSVVAHFVDLADGNDPAVTDSDIGEAAGFPGPIDDRAGSDDVVEHGTSGSGHARRAPGAEI